MNSAVGSLLGTGVNDEAVPSLGEHAIVYRQPNKSRTFGGSWPAMAVPL